ncbi:MAG: hypothetical protein IBX68_12195 [Dehalococcoidia bacterium]|nr:hypothetical protein [Dehalococcoidia bacterium]
MNANTLRWEEVAEGQEIPAISLELTRNRTVMIVCATRDIFPLHHDEEFARSAGYEAPAVATAFLHGFCGRCLTDWAGPLARIRKLGLTLRAPSHTGDTVTVGGRVARKYTEKGEHFVDCDLAITKQDGTVSVDARATIAFCREAGVAGDW